MADQKFGMMYTTNDVEDAVLAHNKLWMDTWLAARERRVGIVPGTISRPRSYIIKRSFNAIPGEETTPLIVVISDGFADPTARRGDGRHDALIRVGVAAVVTAGPEGQAHMLIGHYQAALVGIAIKHRVVGNDIVLHAWNDLTTNDIDDEAQSRTMAAVRLELVYRCNNFVSEFPVPDGIDTPPEDPYVPQPDDPLVQTVHTEVQKP